MSVGLRSLAAFSRDRRGAILAELAIVLPVLAAILLGCFEATRFVLLHQKLDRAASSMADLVAQSDGITMAQINDLFTAAEDQLSPFDLAASGRVIVSSITRPTAAAAQVAWQRLSSGALPATSAMGNEGAAAVLPAGLIVRIGENIIIAEVFYDYEPFFIDAFLSPAVFRHVAFNRPRLINLSTIAP